MNTDIKPANSATTSATLTASTSTTAAAVVATASATATASEATTTATATLPTSLAAGQICIAVDVMGGDDAPGVVLEGIALAIESNPDIQILAVGPPDTVGPFARTHFENCKAVTATEVIGMDEHPANAVRNKKDSSIVVGCAQVKQGFAQGFFSAGSTGACMAAATLIMGRAAGVKRPAIATVLPSPVSNVVLADIGANADVKPEYLLQFAKMATVYAKTVLGVINPRVGLLNIGEEQTKGSALAQEAHALLKDKLPEFVGNAEGNSILSGNFDVIVTDGFTGNVVLKTIEGAAKTFFTELKSVLTAGLTRKLAASMIMPGLKDLKQKLSADEVGGAPLLGLRGACIIGHGSSNPKAIANGIAATAKYVALNVEAKIADALSCEV